MGTKKDQTNDNSESFKDEGDQKLCKMFSSVKIYSAEKRPLFFQKIWHSFIYSAEKGHYFSKKSGRVSFILQKKGHYFSKKSGRVSFILQKKGHYFSKKIW